jgi:xylose isomerase
VNHKLGGLNHVFWGGREGYQTLLNTDMKKECDHMAALYKMAVSYKQERGYTAQFLIEPKPREPTKHQYDYDAATTMAFLYQYGLANDFQLNIEPNHTTLAGHAPEHDIALASAYGMLGSIDSNTGDPLLGWDTVGTKPEHWKMVIRTWFLSLDIFPIAGSIPHESAGHDCYYERGHSARWFCHRRTEF